MPVHKDVVKVTVHESTGSSQAQGGGGKNKKGGVSKRKAKPAAPRAQSMPKRASVPKGAAKPIQQVASRRGNQYAEIKASGNFNRDAATAARTILNPIGSEAFRNPNFSTRPTAVSKLHDQGSLDFPPEGAGSTYLVNEQNSLVAIYNDPRCMKRRTRLYGNGTSSTATYYQWYFPNVNNEMGSSVSPDTPVGQVIQPQEARFVSGTKLHGDRQCAGQFGGFNGVYIAPSEPGESYILIGGLPNSTSVNVLVYKCNKNNWTFEEFSGTTSVSGGLQIPVTDYGHYTIAFTDANDISSGTVSIYTQYSSDSAGKGMTIGQEMCTEFSDYRVQIDSACITATDILLSNVSPILDKNGSVYCAQVPGKTELDFFIPSSAAVKCSEIIGEIQLMKYDVADKGAHAPWVPANAADYREVDCGGCEDINDPVPAYPIDSTSEYVVVVFEIEKAEGRAFHFYHCYHLEWKTNSLMFELGRPWITIEEFNATLRKLGSMGPEQQFTRNENHVQAIGRWLKQKFLPRAGDAAQLLAPMFGAYGPAITMVGRAIRSAAQA
jgi:hypothetical protein